MKQLIGRSSQLQRGVDDIFQMVHVELLDQLEQKLFHIAQLLVNPFGLMVVQVVERLDCLYELAQRVPDLTELVVNISNVVHIVQTPYEDGDGLNEKKSLITQKDVFHCRIAA